MLFIVGNFNIINMNLFIHLLVYPDGWTPANGRCQSARAPAGQTRSSLGLVRTQSGPTPDPLLRTHSGPTPDPIRTQSGPNPDPIWTQSGPNLDPIRTQSGTNPDSLRTQSGPNSFLLRNLGPHISLRTQLLGILILSI